MPRRPLSEIIARLIRATGPVSVAQVMAWALAHSRHGYYRKNAAIGATGDFTTAPEISQCFGELIGVWCVVAWQHAGAPQRLRLIELGPGRGTLMSDLLRSARIVPDFLAAVRRGGGVHCVEINATLQPLQAQTIAATPVGSTPLAVTWHNDMSSIPDEMSGADAMTLVIANEFLDTIPVHQCVFTDGRWHERVVDVNDADGSCALAFGKGAPVDLPPGLAEVTRHATHASILEWRDWASSDLASGLAHLVRAPDARLAALFFDYGHAATALGDTLQAVAGHRSVDVLTDLGQSDLTAHVDFAAFAGAMSDLGLICPPPHTQASFLEALGIRTRAERLLAGADPGQRNRLESGIQRLMAVPGMGNRFLVQALLSPAMAAAPLGPPFPFSGTP